MNNNTNEMIRQSRMPPTELWVALLDIYNHYLFREIAIYRLLPPEARPPDEVFQALNVLNDWLDVAIREGWLDC